MPGRICSLAIKRDNGATNYFPTPAAKAGRQIADHSPWLIIAPHGRRVMHDNRHPATNKRLYKDCGMRSRIRSKPCRDKARKHTTSSKRLKNRGENVFRRLHRLAREILCTLSSGTPRSKPTLRSCNVALISAAPTLVMMIIVRVQSTVRTPEVTCPSSIRPKRAFHTVGCAFSTSSKQMIER